MDAPHILVQYSTVQYNAIIVSLQVHSRNTLFRSYAQWPGLCEDLI